MELHFILPITLVAVAFVGCDSKGISPSGRQAMDVRQNSAQTSPTFIVVTQEYRWPNGVGSRVGQVERVMAVENNHYLIWQPSNSRYLLPNECAKVITVEDAALRLVAHRQQLSTQLESASAHNRTTSSAIAVDRSSDLGGRRGSEGQAELPIAPHTWTALDRPDQAISMPPPIDWNARQRASSHTRVDEAVRNSRRLEAERQARDAEAVARGAERGMERALRFGF